MSGSWNKRYGAIPKATQEIVIEDFAPTLDIHKPAGKFPSIQKRRWKTWYHVDNKFNPTTIINTYVRAGRKNEWMLIENQEPISCLSLDYVNETYVTDNTPRSAFTTFLTAIVWGVQSWTNFELWLEWIVPNDFYTDISRWDNWLNLFNTYPWQTLVSLSWLSNTIPNIYIRFSAWNVWYKLKSFTLRYVDINWNPQELFTNFITTSWDLWVQLDQSYIVNNIQWIGVVKKWDNFYYIDEDDNLVLETNQATIDTYNTHIDDNNFVCSSHAVDEKYQSILNKDYINFDYSRTGGGGFSWHLITKAQFRWSTFEITNDNNVSITEFNIYIDDNITEGAYFYVKTGDNVNVSNIRTIVWSTVTTEWLLTYPLLPNTTYMFMFDEDSNDLKEVFRISEPVPLPTTLPTYITLWANVTNNTVTMSPIAWLTMTLATGWYRVEFTPLYNVNATTTGTGWNFQWGTAVLSNYSFRSILPSTATASHFNNYVSRSQNFTTAQTSRTTDNRWTIIAEFQVTTAGTVIPHFRSEVAWWLVTLRTWSIVKIEKLW